MQLGVDSYTYHRFFGEVRPGEARPSVSWSHDDLVAEVIDSGAEVVSLETCYLPGLDAGRLESAIAPLQGAGVEVVLAWGHPEGLAGGLVPEAHDEVLSLLDVLPDLGVGLLRIVAGGPRQWQAEPEARVVARLRRCLDELTSVAVDQGVTLALETHCELSPGAFVDLAHEVGPALGVVLDTGNVIRVGGDLLELTEALADQVVMVHAKDLTLNDLDPRTTPAGIWWCTAVGEGRLPIAACIDQLVEAQFDGPICVELMELDPTLGLDEPAVVRRSLATLSSWRDQYRQTTGVGPRVCQGGTAPRTNAS